MKNTYRFFVNKDCEYYPCHESVEELNCLFCYCQLYGREYCPGDPEYVEIKQNAAECGTGVEPRGRFATQNASGLSADGVRRVASVVKSCEHCTFPHEVGNYDLMMQFLAKESGGSGNEMTEIAVLADIHNNHVAFEACICLALEKGVQKFIFLGDYISDCPYPQRTMQLLYELEETYDCVFICGNREE